jgi:hypothetical protein
MRIRRENEQAKKKNSNVIQQKQPFLQTPLIAILKRFLFRVSSWKDVLLWRHLRSLIEGAVACLSVRKHFLFSELKILGRLLVEGGMLEEEGHALAVVGSAACFGELGLGVSEGLFGGRVNGRNLQWERCRSSRSYHTTSSSPRGELCWCRPSFAAGCC